MSREPKKWSDRERPGDIDRWLSKADDQNQEFLMGVGLFILILVLSILVIKCAIDYVH